MKSIWTKYEITLREENEKADDIEAVSLEDHTLSFERELTELIEKYNQAQNGLYFSFVEKTES